MNSASVAGGIAPAPLHVTWPEAQSAVAHFSFPDGSVVHWVRAHMRPDHGLGTSRVWEAFGASSKPVEESCGPAPVRVPGQTVKGQLLVNVNVAEWAIPVWKKRKEKKIWRLMK